MEETVSRGDYWLVVTLLVVIIWMIGGSAIWNAMAIACAAIAAYFLAREWRR